MCGPNFSTDDDVIMYRAADFFQPDCEVCYRAMDKIEKGTKLVTKVKRTCPKCKRRFQIMIHWFPDKRCEVKVERIADYKKPR